MQKPQVHCGRQSGAGPRGAIGANHDFLVNNVDNYPGAKDDGNAWSFNVYYKDTSP
ncbi:MAG TPA: hypothetical protein VES88_16465 [Gemmatimonadaceae bacterium]|nr:hypothetical protein [Gemmatimonadaceae bacterium]